MRKQWPPEAFAIMWEVAPATGAIRGQARYADAVIMSLWPSRGLHLHGVEIKVSRSDWIREMRNPAKAERVAAYCDFWWLHVTPGVVHDLSEVPTQWGVREFDGKKWKTLREATKLDALPCDRGFLASLMRRSSESTAQLARAMIEGAMKAEREEIAKAIERGIAAHTERQSKAAAAIEAFKEASGIDLMEKGIYGDAYDLRHLGAVVKAVDKLGVGKAYDQVVRAIETVAINGRSLIAHAEQAAEALRAQAPELYADLNAFREAEEARRQAEITARKRR